MSESSVNKKKDAIDLCTKLIPLMTEAEMESLIAVLNVSSDRIIKDFD